jgi:hypothetical protein
VRFSLFHAAVIMIIPTLPFVVVLLAAPQAGAIVSMVIGMSGIVFYLLGTLTLATGTSVGCFPDIAPVFWSEMLPTLVFNTLVPKQWFLGSGLVKQYDYDNSNCMDAALWRTDYFGFNNCYTDLSWHFVTDPVIFPLHQWVPEWLAYWSDPTSWPTPLNAIVAIDLVQEAVHRWDDVNMTTDEVLYSGNWTCWVIMLAACLMVLYFVLVLLRFLPVGLTAQLLAAILVLFIKIAAFFLFGLITVFYYMLMAPLAIQTRARHLLNEKSRLEREMRLLSAEIRAA